MEGQTETKEREKESVIIYELISCSIKTETVN